MKSKIGQVIEDRGLMKKYVAKKLGVSPSQISNWISGKSYPTLNKAFKLAKLLQCKVDDLYEDID
jgi:putative transcriptional regulator